MADTLYPTFRGTLRPYWETAVWNPGVSQLGRAAGITNGSVYGMAVHGCELCAHHEYVSDFNNFTLCFRDTDNPLTAIHNTDISIGATLEDTVDNFIAAFAPRIVFAFYTITKIVNAADDIDVLFQLPAQPNPVVNVRYLDVSCVPAIQFILNSPAVDPETRIPQAMEYILKFKAQPRDGDCVLTQGYPYKAVIQHVIDGYPEIRQTANFFYHDVKQADIDSNQTDGVGVTNYRSSIQNVAHVLRDYVSTPIPKATLNNNFELQEGMMRTYQRYAWAVGYNDERASEIFPRQNVFNMAAIDPEEFRIFNSSCPVEGNPDMRPYTDIDPTRTHSFMFYNNGARGVLDICGFMHQRLYVHLQDPTQSIFLFETPQSVGAINSTNVIPAFAGAVEGVYAIDIMPDVNAHGTEGSTITFHMEDAGGNTIVEPITFNILTEAECCLMDEIVFLNPFGAYQSYLIQCITEETSDITTNLGKAYSECWEVDEVFDYGSEETNTFFVTTRRLGTTAEDTQFIEKFIGSSGMYRFLDDAFYEIAFDGSAFDYPCLRNSFRSRIQFEFMDNDLQVGSNLTSGLSSGSTNLFETCQYLWPDSISMFQGLSGFTTVNYSITSAIVNGVELVVGPINKDFIVAGVAVDVVNPTPCVGGPDSWPPLVAFMNNVPTSLVNFGAGCYTGTAGYNTSISVQSQAGTIFQYTVQATYTTGGGVTISNIVLSDQNVFNGGLFFSSKQCG